MLGGEYLRSVTHHGGGPREAGISSRSRPRQGRLRKQSDQYESVGGPAPRRGEHVLAPSSRHGRRVRLFAGIEGTPGLRSELKDAPVGAALDSICADYNLFWRIEPEAGFIFTVAESTNSRQQIKAGLLKNRSAWPELPPSLAQWIVNDKAHDAGTGRAVHTRYVDGGAFTWRIEQQGTALAVVPHQAIILKE